MNFWFKGHHYKTHILFGIKTRLSKWFGSYKWPVTMWVSHEDDCCDYWLTDPEGMINAIRMDDDLGVKPPPQSSTLKKESENCERLWAS